MARQEKKFGDIAQAASTSFSELVTASTTSTRNVLINIAARSATSVTAAVFTAAPILAASSASLAMTITSSVTSARGGSANGLIFNSPYTGAPTHAIIPITAASTTTLLLTVSNGVTAESTVSYGTNGYNNLFERGWGTPQDTYGTNGYNGDYTRVPFSSPAKFIDENTAIFSYQLQAQVTTAAIASHTYLVATFNTASSSFTANYDNANNQGNGSNEYKGTIVWEHAGVNNAKAYSLFVNGSTLTTASASSSIGLRIVTKSNTTFSEGNVVWTGTTATTRTPMKLMAFFAAGDYNQTYPAYAFSHPSATTADNTWYGISSTSASASVGSVTLPSGPSNAGFRIVATDGTSAIRKFLDGTITYPAAPTGVTVPTDHTRNQVVSLKFSPNGKYLAVAYLRPAGSIGTSTANSVVVVYERQVDGAYNHVASSGTNITIVPAHNDAMAWTSDSASIIVAAYGTTASATATTTFSQYWHTGLVGEENVGNVNVPTFTIGWNKYPLTNSVIDPATGSSRVYSGTSAAIVTTTSTSSTNVMSLTGVTSFADNTGLPLVFITGAKSAGTGGQGHTVTRLVTSITGTVGSGNYPNYVNSVISGIPVTKGSVTQVSNIVLSPGESLHVEAADANAIDAAAYGIEIS